MSKRAYRRASGAEPEPWPSLTAPMWAEFDQHPREAACFCPLVAAMRVMSERGFLSAEGEALIAPFMPKETA